MNHRPSFAELQDAVRECIKANPGIDPSGVVATLEHLDYAKGGVSMLRAALLDLLDTGEIDDERPGMRRQLFYEPDEAKRHGRWR